jgi:hypothetical protein
VRPRVGAGVEQRLLDRRVVVDHETVELRRDRLGALGVALDGDDLVAPLVAISTRGVPMSSPTMTIDIRADFPARSRKVAVSQIRTTRSL